MDAGGTVILHRTGRIVKKLSHASEKKIRDIIKAEAGPEVILEKRGGAFTFDIDVKSGEAIKNRWQTSKKTIKPSSNNSSNMELDVVDTNRFDPLREDDEDSLQCGGCSLGELFHRP